MVLLERVGAMVGSVRRFVSPIPPTTIHAEVQRRQLMRIRGQLPMLYAIGSLNVLIVMAVCMHNDVPVRSYGWMSALIVLAVVRTTLWLRQKPEELPPKTVSLMLTRSAWISGAMLCVLGAFTSATFYADTFGRSTLMPISLAFGSMSIAHCFATVRPSAVGAIGFGIVMSAVTMGVVGNFDARVLAVIMLSVAALMIRFVAGQYDQLVTEVQLQREVYDLANTDALTQLPNRRAVMAVMTEQLSGNGVFGVALLDLDGFKGINDRLGHLAGDALLQVVAQRLLQGGTSGDTVARLGGDEFFPSGGRLAEFLVLFRHVRDVRASLGLATAPADGSTPAALLGAADAALYAVKRARHAAPALEQVEHRRRRQRSAAMT
jgi:diguanylate cyclase